MARKLRSQLPPGWYHCINRGVNRNEIFHDIDDYRWFINAIKTHRDQFDVDLRAYCIMPNHWHIVLHCKEVAAMSGFFKKVLNNQTRRHHTKYQIIGHGPIYQGRYKSLLIKDDRALSTICQYVEQNPVRAKLVSQSIFWPWSSATE